MRSKVDLRALALVALLALLVAIPMGVLGVTSTTFVKGTISTPDPVKLSSDAVAVITLVDRSARGGSGVILGQRRVANPGTTPFEFSVRYDPARIQEDHAYVLFAAVIDGAKRWQNPDGVPVITGGPTSGVDVRVKKVNTDPVATIPGEITKKDKAALTGKAVALAAVLDRDTGRTVAWTAITPSGDVPIEFALGYDPATLNTGGDLVAWAGIVDGGSVWESASAVPLLAAGPNLSAGSISVTPATELPTAPEATPTPTPKPTPTPVTIPSVRDQPEAQAVDTIEAADLTVAETARKYNASIAKGNAVKTSPEAGTKVKPDSGVKLVVSKGPSPSPSPAPTPKPTPSPTPKPVTVPDVRGQAEADAVITLTDASLKIGERPKRFNDKVPAGAAIKTDPAVGTRVKVGSAVDLYVSKGPEPSASPSPSPTVTPTPVAVPDVRGMTEADAVVELSDIGLKVGDRNQRTNESVAAGRIIKTAPEGGAKVAPGSRVDLFISTGPAPTPTPRPVTVPDVSGLPEADAIIALTDVKLEIGERARELDPEVPAGAVILTIPGAGEQVPQGTFVDLVVSNSPAATPTLTPAPTRTPLPSGSPTPSPSLAPWPYPTDGIGILSGTLIYRDTTAPTAQRHVVITLLEEGPFGTRVVPIEQFVDGGMPPQGFVVTFDWAQIDPLARYRVLAAVVDGASAWYTQDGAPAITAGAPVSGLIVPLFQRGDILEGQVTGVIVGVDAGLSATATREAFLVRGDTGAVVAYDAGPAGTASRVQVFNIPYLLEDIDQAVPYLVVARVIDGARIWTGPGVPVVTLGAPYKVVVEVSPLLGPEQALDAPDP